MSYSESMVLELIDLVEELLSALRPLANNAKSPSLKSASRSAIEHAETVV